jgi:GGDEF domain-containing protein
MISIRKLMAKDNRESAEAYERMAQLLLQAIGLHAVEGDRVDYDWFSSTIAGLQTGLSQDPSPANVLATTGTAVKTLEEYNRRTSHFIKATSAELQIIVGMLTEAMSQISTGSQTSVHRLQELQKQIEHASQVEDVRTLKLGLSDCLHSIRGECDRQRDEALEVVANLKRGIQKAQETKVPEAGAVSDPLTGLLLRPGAEDAMQAACDRGAHAYAGLFVMDRLQAVTSRFGNDLGDQVLLFFVQHLSTALTGNDTLFRWSPTSFLALIERRESPDNVRREMAKLLTQRLEQTFEIGDRSVVLPVSSTWVVVPLFEQGYTEIVRKLDAFSGTQRSA